jgi:predicted aspartyl protease
MSTKVLLLYATVLFIGEMNVCAQAKIFSLNHGQAEKENYYTQIPYQDINGKIVIEISLNGKLQKFMLDTGAPLTITENLSKELNPEVLGYMDVSDANGIMDSVKAVSLSGINIGGVVFNNIPALVKDMDMLSCWNADGIIGSNLLRNSIVRFDPEEKIITLTDNYSANQFLGKGVSSEIKPDSIQSTPVIIIHLIDEKRDLPASCEVVFDTGDNSFYTVSVRNYSFFEEKAPGLFNLLAEGEGAHMLSINQVVDQQHYLLEVPELIINGINFKNVVASTTQAVNSRIGSAILNYGSVTLDYINRKFYFCPTLNVPHKYWGIAPVFRDNKFVVGVVWDKSLSDRVNPGDEILEIDGIDYKSASFCDLINGSKNLLAGKNEAKIVLKDVHTGKKKRVKMSRYGTKK